MKNKKLNRIVDGLIKTKKRMSNIEQGMSNVEVFLLLRFEIPCSSFALKEMPLGCDILPSYFIICPMRIEEIRSWVIVEKEIISLPW